jgi:hypothetical protein
VTVRGASVSGFAVATMLMGRGIRVTVAGVPESHGPLIVLNSLTLRLLKDLGCDRHHEIFARCHEVHSHFVAWGDTVATFHRYGIAISRADLLRILQPQVKLLDICNSGWTVLALGRDGASEYSHEVVRCGLRYALTVPVTLNPNVRESCTVMEAVPGGWLFLIPKGRGAAVLQVGIPAKCENAVPLLESLLDRSRYISDSVDDVTGPVCCHAAMPSFSLPAAGHGWIAVGDAAMAYDPISGDGVGAALRTAALAVAVLVAIQRGENEQTCLNHYSRRLGAAMKVHLQTLVNDYSRTRDLSWSNEIEAMRSGLDCLSTFQAPAEFRLEVSGRRAITSG